MDKERVKLILGWAMRNRAEDTVFDERFYYWTPEAKKIFNKLTMLGGDYGDCLLIGVIGQSGVGKSALLKALKWKLMKWFEKKYGSPGDYQKVLTVKWKPEDFEFYMETFQDHHTVFIDMPDYGTKDIRRINKDLNILYEIWRFLRQQYEWFELIESDAKKRYQVNIVVFLQKELVKRQQHFFLRKMDIVELRPLKPDELVHAFLMRFEDYEPFTRDSLMLIAELSRGIFRRFMRYIQLCLEDMIERNADKVTVEDVENIITDNVLMQDMELEFFDIFRNQRYANYATRIISFLIRKKEADQKTIAEYLNIHPTIAGRIISTLEQNGYVTRERGKRAQWLVKIQRCK